MNYDLLIDLHKGNLRQGPGSDAQTKQALDLCRFADDDAPLKIADIGCGTGASSLCLAENLAADIIAVDLFPEFLELLQERSTNRALKGHIKTLACSMDHLPFEDQSLDVIWSEGAIYNMGFAAGIDYFKRFIKPAGYLVASEITWLTQERPQALNDHWQKEYPEIATASEKIAVLESKGFVLKGYFPLPVDCWQEHYYAPLQEGFEAFLSKHPSREAKDLIEAERAEIELYNRYRDYYSYGFYIAQKL